MDPAAPLEDLVDDEASDDDELAIAPASFFGGIDDELVDRAVCTRVYGLFLRDSVRAGHAEPAEAALELSRALHADAVARKQRRARQSLPPPPEGEGNATPRRFDAVVAGEHLATFFQRSDARDFVRSRRPNAAPAPIAISSPPTSPTTEAAPLPPAEVLVVALAAGETESAARTALREGHRALAKRLGRAPSVSELFAHLGEDAKSTSNVRQGAKRAGLELTPERGGGERRTKPATSAPRSAKRPRSVSLTVREPDEGDAPAPPSGGVGASLAIMALQGERSRIQSQLDAVDAVIARLRV